MSPLLIASIERNEDIFSKELQNDGKRTACLSEKNLSFSSFNPNWSNCNPLLHLMSSIEHTLHSCSALSVLFSQNFSFIFKGIGKWKIQKNEQRGRKKVNFSSLILLCVSQVDAFTHVPYIAQSSSIYVCKSKNKVLLLLCLPKNKVNGERSNWIANASQFLLKWERPCKKGCRERRDTQKVEQLPLLPPQLS